MELKHKLLFLLLAAATVSAAKYEAGTYFEPTGNVGYILGQDQYMDSITVLGSNLLFTNSSVGIDILFYGVATSPSNITLYVVNQSYVNHTCDLHSSVDFTVTGLDWGRGVWYVYNGYGSYQESDTSAPLDFTLADTVTYAYYTDTLVEDYLTITFSAPAHATSIANNTRLQYNFTVANNTKTPVDIQLWGNTTGTWQALNTTTATTGLNQIAYTWPDVGTYIWGGRVNASDGTVNWTTSNRTIYVVTTTTTTSTTTTTMQVTYTTFDNKGYRPCFAHLMEGRMLRMGLCVYETSFGGERTDEQPTNWFYFILLMIVVIPFTISLSKLAVPVLLMDMILAVFWGYVPPEAYPIIALLNVFVFAEALFYRPFAPHMNN